MELTGMGEGAIKEGYLVAMATPANTQKRGCGPGLDEVKCHGWEPLEPQPECLNRPHSSPRSLGPGHQQALPVPLRNARDEDGHGKDQQASQVWVFLPQPQNRGGPSRRYLENSTERQKRLDLQFFFFPLKL